MKGSSDVWAEVAELRRSGEEGVVVTLIGLRGSVPGELGAKALVSGAGLVSGNLGGGKVEARAVEEAQGRLEAWLGDGAGEGEACAVRTWNLQRDIGMTCGGEMTFLFERVVGREPWHLAVFGAGHVSQALVPVLARLACRVDVFDPREDWLGRFPDFGNVKLHRVAAFEDGVAELGPETYVLCITQGHSSDRPVLRDALRRWGDLPFLGVIGSAAKRAVLLRELREDGIEDGLLAGIYCPVGLALGGNDPAEIAISVAAQLLQIRDSRGRTG
jgi:xanthine dehydrogenase accessory factor